MTDAALAAQISELLDSWQQREDELKAWVGGSPTGGPNGDGLYPLTAPNGTSSLVPCPAKLAATVGGPAASAGASADAAETSASAALAAAGTASTAASTASGHAATANTRKLEAEAARDVAGTHAANAAAAVSGFSATAAAAAAAVETASASAILLVDAAGDDAVAAVGSAQATAVAAVEAAGDTAEAGVSAAETAALASVGALVTAAENARDDAEAAAVAAAASANPLTNVALSSPATVGSTTFVDTDLTLAVAPGSYLLDAMLISSSTSTGGINAALSAPSGTTANGFARTRTGVAERLDSLSALESVSLWDTSTLSNQANELCLRLTVTTAGSIRIRIRRTASDQSASLRPGSWLTLNRLP